MDAVDGVILKSQPNLYKFAKEKVKTSATFKTYKVAVMKLLCFLLFQL